MVSADSHVLRADIASVPNFCVFATLRCLAGTQWGLEAYRTTISKSAHNFFRVRILQENPRDSAEEQCLTNFKLRVLDNLEPDKLMLCGAPTDVPTSLAIQLRKLLVSQPLVGHCLQNRTRYPQPLVDV